MSTSAPPASVLAHPAPPQATARPLSLGLERGTSFVIGLATVLMGLIAGFFYAYACSVMIGLDRADDRTFIVTMQVINATVRNWYFAVSFFGALVVSILALGLAVARRDLRTARWVGLGAICYLAAFLITMGISVPLNNELRDAGNPDLMANMHAVRDGYEGDWIRWNVVRTVFSTVALVALVRAMMVRGVLGKRPA